MSYEAGRSKSYNHGVPTTEQTCDAGFMQGYRDGEASRRAQASFHTSPEASWNKPLTERSIEGNRPSEPLTLASAVKGFAITGTVLGILYAYLVLNALPGTVATYGASGLIAGIAAGVAAFMASKALQFAAWLLLWAIKIGAVLALMFFAWSQFAH